MLLQKFGGTSVRTRAVMAAARRSSTQTGRPSGRGGRRRCGDTTDELIDLAREITEQPPAREMDMLLATGEQMPSL